MNYDNQHLGHENPLHPMHERETPIIESDTKAEIGDIITVNQNGAIYTGEVQNYTRGDYMWQDRYEYFDETNQIDRWCMNGEIVNVAKKSNHVPYKMTPSQAESDDTTKECRKIVDETIDKSEKSNKTK